jgi:hypothetical protein
MIIKDECVRTLKQKIVADLEVLSRHKPQDTGKIHENLIEPGDNYIKTGKGTSQEQSECHLCLCE